MASKESESSETPKKASNKPPMSETTKTALSMEYAMPKTTKKVSIGSARAETPNKAFQSHPVLPESTKKVPIESAVPGTTKKVSIGSAKPEAPNKASSVLPLVPEIKKTMSGESARLETRMISSVSSRPRTRKTVSSESARLETRKTISSESARPETPKTVSNESARLEITKTLSSESARLEASNNTTGSEENRQGTSSQRKRKNSKNDRGVPKKPQRGMGVAQLERLRLRESLAGGESLNVQNNLQPPMPPFYMQQGGPAGYVGYPPINAGYFMGYPTVGGYPNQQALMSPYGFYPVHYTGSHPGSTAELSSMPKPPSSSQGFYPMNCTGGRPSEGPGLFLGNPAFHGHIEEKSNNQAPDNVTAGQAPDIPIVIIEEEEDADGKDKVGSSFLTKNYMFYSAKAVNSSSSSKPLPGDGSTEEASEASPEDTTIGNDGKDSSGIDLTLKL